MQFSEAQFLHPLAVKAEAQGLRVWYPGSRITANKVGVFGAAAGEGEDLIIGHADVEAFTDARVDGIGDWTVTARLDGGGGKALRVTYGHGLPFVYGTVTGGKAMVRFKEKPAIWSGEDFLKGVGLTVKGKHYALFAGTGTEWELAEDGKQLSVGRKGYFSVAILPDDRPETLELFSRYAHNHVNDTRVRWSFDEKSGAVETRFEIVSEAMEGDAKGTLYAMYPHQWGSTV